MLSVPRLSGTSGNFSASFDVINAGTSGYGPDQNLLRLEDEIPVLKPDIVVFQVFADNDFDDMIRNKIFEIRDGRLVRRHPQISFGNKAEYYCAKSYICRSLRKVSKRIRKPAPVNTLELCEREFASYQRDNVVDFPMWEDHYDEDIRSASESPSAKYKIELMTLLIAELKKWKTAIPELKPSCLSSRP